MFVKVDHTLGGVVYVLKTWRNLISLGCLDSKGCRYSVAGGVMKITQGCLVLKKGERCQDGMYRLSGSMVTSIPLTSMGSRKWSV